MRKSEEAGALVHHDSEEEDSEDGKNDKTVLYCTVLYCTVLYTVLYCTVTGDDDKTVPAAADHDYQRPAKLDLVVGFLRSYCTVQYCTVL